MTTPDLDALLTSWELALRAERKSPATLTSYLTGCRLYLAWCRDNGHPVAIDKRQLAAWVAGLLDSGAEANTARLRQLAVRRYSSWLADEGEIAADPLLGVKPPKLDQKVMQTLEVPDLERLLKACQGKDFRALRDMAIIRLMIETGLRSEEVLALNVADIDLPAGIVTVRRGKGGKSRTVACGPQTMTAIDRYMRARRTHRWAGTVHLFLGDDNKTFSSYHALYVAIKQRAAVAGLPEWVTPHTLRRTWATRWLDAEGSESGLMAAAGWTRGEMVRRYTRHTGQRRAMDEARRLHLGDL